LLPDVLCLPDLRWPNPRPLVLTATATVWSAVIREVIVTGAEGGAEAIGMKAGVVAGATAVATDMAQAFGSKAGIRAWRYDVTQMSPCGPASTRL
jgi:hypothetical protein